MGTLSADTTASQADSGLRPLANGILLLLVFVSGASALLYQMLWMRTLSLTFGNAAQASAVTLAAFFLGLGLGSRLLGRAVSKSTNPLRSFAVLELGVVAGALWFMMVSAGLGHIVPAVEDPDAVVLVNVKRFVLAVLAMLPATLCMGGTLPALGEVVSDRVAGFGRRVALVYGINTLGGMLGASLGAFVLPPILGFRMTLVAALSASMGVAIVAGLWSRRCRAVRRAKPSITSRWRPGRALAAAAVLSGAATLALEVLWTRMFAQVFHNSVYSFGAVLAIFLFALGIGALVGRALARSRFDTHTVLTCLWLGAGLLAGVTPFVFEHFTHGMSYVGRELDFSRYVAEVLSITALVLLLPVTVMGSIFPYLMSVAEKEAHRIGETVGDLAALNIAGAVVGALSAGFVLLTWLGLWVSIGLVAVLYVLAAVVLMVPARPGAGSAISRGLPAGAIVLLVTVLNPAGIDPVKVDRRSGAELPVEHWEGPHGVVAVVRRDRDLALKINNFYTLGSTAGINYERRQAHLPLAVHGEARTAFFLGLGTGITAGAALEHPIESLVVVELTREVVTAARAHFTPYINGLFSDSRAQILVEDGRSYLRQTSRKFDVIVSDLFVPWRAGVGSLYTREHFAAIRARLNSDGIFCQWLPMFQLDEEGFKTIASSFVDVFPDATLWRGDFFGSGSILALIGHTVAPRFSPEWLVRAHRAFMAAGDTPALPGAVGSSALDFFLYYAGNLGESRALLDGAYVDTDNRSRMSFLAPIAQRQVAAGQNQWFDALPLTEFFSEMLARTPPRKDPVLAGLDEEVSTRVRAGLALHRAQAYRHVGKREDARRFFAEFRRLLRADAPLTGETFEARTALRREIQLLRSELEGRLQALEDRLPPLERPQ